jgi:hypothetical protein
LQEHKAKRPKKIPKLVRRVDVENVAPAFKPTPAPVTDPLSSFDLPKPQDAASSHDPQLAYLRELLYPTSYNLLIGTEEGSKNMFDVDLDMFGGVESCVPMVESSGSKCVEPMTQNAVSLLTED